ncbi:unnamed protein product [Pedinophyceae sp. YPF-701]|nr:unnamed protein product [Pedinophyceae sp. YPF-701]
MAGSRLQAGKPGRKNVGNTAECLTFEEAPDVPDEVRRYQSANLQQEAGRTYKHFGSFFDRVPEGPFGVNTEQHPDDTVSNVIKQGRQGMVGQVQDEIGEAVYETRRREPLGRSMVRGHELPDGMGSEVPFGRPLGAKELDRQGQVREVMEATKTGEDDESVRQMYVRTHGDYAPGEQRRRGYNWGGVDPDSNVFGRPGAKKDPMEMKKIMSYPQGPSVVSRTLADYKLGNEPELGRVRTLGFGDRETVMSGTAAGVPSLHPKMPAEPGVEVLLRHQYSGGGCEPDPDLGRSLRPGYRNIVEDPDKVFGVPTVRTDLPMPQPGSRSVADAQNYGNEPDAAALLFPAGFVSDDILTQPISLEEAKELCDAAGVQIEEAVAARAWEEGARTHPGGQCTFGAFLRMKEKIELGR